jgi:hypothetical protein
MHELRPGGTARYHRIARCFVKSLTILVHGRRVAKSGIAAIDATATYFGFCRRNLSIS